MAHPIIVVGCGVIGLTSAIGLQESGFAVTIITRDLPPNLTSAVAGAYWYGGELASHPARHRWSSASLQEYLHLANGDYYGVSTFRMLEDPTQSPRVGRAVPTVAAWRKALIDHDVPGALSTLAARARLMRRIDVSFGLSLELEYVLLLEHTTGLRAVKERTSLQAIATQFEANGIARACE